MSGALSQVWSDGRVKDLSNDASFETLIEVANVVRSAWTGHRPEWVVKVDVQTYLLFRKAIVAL